MSLSDVDLPNYEKSSEQKVSCPVHHSRNTNAKVLDRLEETYWATWKPKRAPLPPRLSRKARKVPPEVCDQPTIPETVSNSTTSKARGDASDVLVKYFMAKKFEPSSREESTEGLNESKMEPVAPRFVERGSDASKTEGACQNVSVAQERDKNEDRGDSQQTKGVRLYRKPCTSSGYVRGGSYPLKSYHKREPIGPRGQFRLGAPGSPLFVTSNSFSRKTK
ncbi:uncharacterized protein LOC132704310 [Cylas formicarius]|uniref:uncharacterized protein LOC132704310 n=1 Tax=Cylas formicarius TaxID=197179 RepID=UPI0029588C8D|nr:uncharacterized protein LOC132704310 [Cylas formicarius]